MRRFTHSATNADLEAWLHENVDSKIVALALAMLADGRACWQWDPEVDRVIGLVHANDHTRAYIVIYDLGGDFECDGDFEDLAHK